MILAEVVGTLVCHEVPGVAEGSNHSLVEGALLYSSQVLLELLHSRHANDDSIALFALEYKVTQCIYCLRYSPILDDRTNTKQSECSFYQNGPNVVITEVNVVYFLKANT